MNEQIFVNNIANIMNTTSCNTPKTKYSWSTHITRRRIVVVACLLIATGYLLMAGPGSTEQSFCADIFSQRRIVLAPLLCLSGYLLIIVAVLRNY
jgi:hypothetical protein